MDVRSLTDKDFYTVINESTLPVLVDFYADWCQPCRRVAPLIREIAQEYDGRALVCKVNVDENEALAREFNIMSIPMILSFKNGTVHKSALGAVPKAELLELLR